MPLHKTVLSTASRVRLYMESVASFEHFPIDLCGLCARATGVLLFALRQAGVEGAEAVVTEYHVTARYQGVALDITATQFLPFRGQPVVALPWGEYQEILEGDIGEFKILDIVHFTAGLRRSQVRLNWHDPELFSAKDIRGFLAWERKKP